MNISRNFFRISIIIPFLLLLNPILNFTSDAQNRNLPYITSDTSVSITVVFAGDAMVHSTQYKSAYVDSIDAYNFNPVFQYIKPLLQESAINVVNLETTLADKPYSGYPNFSSPDAFAFALNHAGFNYFALANNHSVDKAKNGLLRTLDVLQEYGISSTGTFRDSADRALRNTHINEVNNIKVSILNYTYGTNGIAVPEPTIVNLIDTALIRYDIAEARQKGAEAILVYFHWGNEYERKPNAYQRRIAEFTFKCGADIIIGSHPHVVQPVELFEYEQDSVKYQKWIAWSLGNFVSNQRDKHTDGGIMLKFNIEKNTLNNRIDITHVTAIPYWVYRPLNPTRFFILPTSFIDENHSIISEMSDKDFNVFKTFKTETEKHLQTELTDSL